jgi:hypothetical protein
VTAVSAPWRASTEKAMSAANMTARLAISHQADRRGGRCQRIPAAMAATAEAPMTTYRTAPAPSDSR